MSDEFFWEVCGGCKKEKMVRDDDYCSYDNPGFICKDCYDAREKWQKEYIEAIQR